jgi:hypothetical protein
MMLYAKYYSIYWKDFFLKIIRSLQCETSDDKQMQSYGKKIQQDFSQGR